MRALLYKDFYMLRKYNGFFMLAVLGFIIIAGMGTKSLFFAVYPPVVVMALGYSSLAYDERSGWLRYADTLPYGRKKIVASKYLLSFLCGLTSLILLIASMTAFRLTRGQLDLRQLGIVAVVVMLVSNIYISILLPISFWLGTEKGRLIYVILTVLVCCSGYSIPMPKIPQHAEWWMGAVLILGIAAVLWVSYQISVKLYQRRKL